MGTTNAHKTQKIAALNILSLMTPKNHCPRAALFNKKIYTKQLLAIWLIENRYKLLFVVK